MTLSELIERVEKLEHAVAFTAKMAWRTDPLTDTERLSAIKHHPTVKEYGEPHIALSAQERGDAP